jgi:hypothetical protein
MRKYILYIWILLGLTACGGGEIDGELPFMSKDYISVTSRVELQGNGQETQINISANCDWSITKDADWLTVTPTSGSSSQTIMLSATKNISGAERTATLMIRSSTRLEKKITVVQANTADSSKTPAPGDNLPPE